MHTAHLTPNMQAYAVMTAILAVAGLITAGIIVHAMATRPRSEWPDPLWVGVMQIGSSLAAGLPLALCLSGAI